jgi:fimbrial isopeptide formation D2 family protein/LPXTG-motif cell wall-anchored protein
MALSCFSASAFAGDGEKTSGDGSVGPTSTTINGVNYNNVYCIDGNYFQLYQVFTGRVSQSSSSYALSDIKAGSSAIESLTNDNASEIAQRIPNVESEAAAYVAKYVDWAEPYSGTADKQITIKRVTENNSYHYEFKNVPDGYYLIRQVPSSIDGTETVSSMEYTLYVADTSNTNNEITFILKSSAPTINKEVSRSGESGSYGSVDSASIGDSVHFRLTASVASTIGNFATYYFKFSDTLSKGLTFNNDAQVYLNNKNNNITDYFYIGTTSNVDTGETYLSIAIGNLKALDNIQGTTHTINYPDEIIVEYTARLNEDAVVGDNGNGNPNKVRLIYSDDPNNSGEATSEPPVEYTKDDETSTEPKPESGTTTGQSMIKEVNVYTAGLELTKVDHGFNVLTGAAFGIKAVDSDEYPSSLTEVITTTNNYVEHTHSDGCDASSETIYYKDSKGEFTTVEEDAAKEDGKVATAYILEAATSTTHYTNDEKDPTYTGEYMIQDVGNDGVVLFKGLGAGEYVISETTTPVGYNTMSDKTIIITFNKETKKFETTSSEFNSVDGVFYADCINTAASALPTTGGIGTTIFYVVGTVLVLGAGVALVVRRRMRKETR